MRDLNGFCCEEAPQAYGEEEAPQTAPQDAPPASQPQVVVSRARGSGRPKFRGSPLDTYYDDRSHESDSVITTLLLMLSEPSPKDQIVTGQLATYKGLRSDLHDWNSVVEACRDLALEIVETSA